MGTAAYGKRSKARRRVSGEMPIGPAASDMQASCPPPPPSPHSQRVRSLFQCFC